MGTIRVQGKHGYFTIVGSIVFVSGELPWEAVLPLSPDSLYLVCKDILTRKLEHPFPQNAAPMLLNVYTERIVDVLEFKGSYVDLREAKFVQYRPGEFRINKWRGPAPKSCPYCQSSFPFIDVTSLSDSDVKLLCRVCGRTLTCDLVDRSPV